MSLESVLDRFSTQDADGSPSGYVVTRSTGPSIDANGNVVDGTFSTFNLIACVQPFSGRSLRILPEGTRSDDARVIDAAVPLLVTPIPDHIVILGEDYAVFKCDGPTTINGFSLYTSYAARQVNP